MVITHALNEFVGVGGGDGQRAKYYPALLIYYSWRFICKPNLWMTLKNLKLGITWTNVWFWFLKLKKNLPQAWLWVDRIFFGLNINNFVNGQWGGVLRSKNICKCPARKNPTKLTLSIYLVSTFVDKRTIALIIYNNFNDIFDTFLFWMNTRVAYSFYNQPYSLLLKLCLSNQNLLIHRLFED